VIVAYAAKFSRAPRSIDRRDVGRLEALGITRSAIAELNSAVDLVNQPARPADTPQ
jgi:uncharacterized protein YciW